MNDPFEGIGYRIPVEEATKCENERERDRERDRKGKGWNREEKGKMGKVLITSRDFNGGFLYAVYFVHDLYHFEPVGSRVFGRKSRRRVALRVLN